VVKDKIIGLLDIMSEEQASLILKYIQSNFKLIQKNTWDNIKEEEPTDEEKNIMKLYKVGEEEYQPYISHEDLKKKLEI